MNCKLNKSVFCLSLIKGLSIDENGPQLLSGIIKTSLNIDHVGVLMGANVANDVAKGDFVESTLACDTLDETSKELQRIKSLFECDHFRVEIVDDVCSVELIGAMKNVIAMGAGVIKLNLIIKYYCCILVNMRDSQFKMKAFVTEWNAVLVRKQP